MTIELNNRFITIFVDVTKSPRITLELKDASKLIECLESEGYVSVDLLETKTILKSFDEYLRLAKRRFQDYIVPNRDPREVVEGKCIVHKVKLLVKNDLKIAELVLDRRVDLDRIKGCLERIGFIEVVIEQT